MLENVKVSDVAIWSPFKHIKWILLGFSLGDALNHSYCDCEAHPIRRDQEITQKLRSLYNLLLGE